MRLPCEEVAVGSGVSDAPCKPSAGPWILAAAILGSSMAFIDSTVVNVALPALQSSLNATVVDVQWVIESYGLFLGALILLGGSIGDRLGRRRMFLSGTAVFAAASIWCGLASSIHQLVMARAVQGVGAAFLVPGSLSIISASFPEAERGRAIGTWSGFTSMTTAIGPVLGGWLIQHASWRWAFLINVPLAIAVIAISMWHVPESRSRKASRIDVLGAALGTVGLGGLVYGLVESPNLGWRSPAVIASLIVGLICLIAFPLVENRVASPMVPPGLFKSRTFAGANLLTLFLYAAFGIFFFVFPLNLIQVQGYSATAAGAAALPLILLMFFLSRWSGGLVTRYVPRPPLMVGPIIEALGFLLFAAPSVGGSYWSTFFPAFLVLGFGMAVTVAPLTAVVMGAVDQDLAGTASGINNAVARVAGLLAVAVFGVVMVASFQHRLGTRLAESPMSAQSRQEVEANSIKLAALPAPSDLDPRARQLFAAAIQQSFIFAFRIIVLISAVLALVSAVCGWRMIEPAAARARRT
jgi:EmrB/QacA subfamily drug resistance transporter